MYRHGDSENGVRRDVESAVRHLRLAADRDLAPAQYSLGCMYNTGDGVEHDATEACSLFQRAAANGTRVHGGR